MMDVKRPTPSDIIIKRQKFKYKERLLKAAKKLVTSRGWCGSVDSACACELKDRWFDYQSGNMPGLRARSSVGDAQGATTH